MKVVTQITALIIFSLLSVVSHAEDASPVGIWKTIDDVSGKPKAIVKVWESDQKLYGKILKVFPRPGVEVATVCKECKGSLHNQPITGLVFMESLKRSKENNVEWSGGQILDPKNGKSYHCSLQVADNGQKMNVRGYLGLPLFGRTQTWIRESNEHVRA